MCGRSRARAEDRRPRRCRVSLSSPLRADGVALACAEKNGRIRRDWPPVNGFQPTSARRRFRLAALIVAGLCVLAVAAGVFAVSYPGVRAIAITAGAPPGLARIYPGIFDAVLLVACAAAFSLRGLARGYAWLTILVIATAVAAADAAHALTVIPPLRPLEAALAIVPWVLLLVGLTLVYAMARQRRPGRDAAAGAPGHGQAPAAGHAGTPAGMNGGAASGNGATVVPLSALLAGRPPAPAAGARATAADSNRPVPPATLPDTPVPDRPAGPDQARPGSSAPGRVARPEGGRAAPPAGSQSASPEPDQAAATAGGQAAGREPGRAAALPRQGQAPPAAALAAGSARSEAAAADQGQAVASSRGQPVPQADGRRPPGRPPAGATKPAEGTAPPLASAVAGHDEPDDARTGTAPPPPPLPADLSPAPAPPTG